MLERKFQIYWNIFQRIPSVDWKSFSDSKLTKEIRICDTYYGTFYETNTHNIWILRFFIIYVFYGTNIFLVFWPLGKIFSSYILKMYIRLVACFDLECRCNLSKKYMHQLFSVFIWEIRLKSPENENLDFICTELI